MTAEFSPWRGMRASWLPQRGREPKRGFYPRPPPPTAAGLLPVPVRGIGVRAFPHRVFTGAALACALNSAGRYSSPDRRRALVSRRSAVDIVFILLIAGLYAISHGIAWAIARLGGEP